MQRDQAISYSNIGTWSEAKLELIRKYGTAYSTILSNRPRLTHVYIDAFAGAGCTSLGRRASWSKDLLFESTIPALGWTFLPERFRRRSRNAAFSRSKVPSMRHFL